jgi:hypothetical protein
MITEYNKLILFLMLVITFFFFISQILALALESYLYNPAFCQFIYNEYTFHDFTNTPDLFKSGGR